MYKNSLKNYNFDLTKALNRSANVIGYYHFWRCVIEQLKCLHVSNLLKLIFLKLCLNVFSTRLPVAGFVRKVVGPYLKKFRIDQIGGSLKNRIFPSQRGVSSDSAK